MFLHEDISEGYRAMRDQSGQYRNAVASGKSQNADNCLILETDPTLPRFGTDRSSNLIVWLRLLRDETQNSISKTTVAEESDWSD